MYLLVTARKGISSLQLAKQIGVTQKSAWFMLQRLREACGNRHEHKRKGLGRGSIGKTPVLAARERGGRVRAKVVRETERLCQAQRADGQLLDEHRHLGWPPSECLREGLTASRSALDSSLTTRLQTKSERIEEGQRQ
jgi:hypothetical protein